MKKILTLSMALAAMLFSTAQAEYVTLKRAAFSETAPNFDLKPGKQYRIVSFTGGGDGAFTNPTFFSIASGTATVPSFIAENDLDDTRQRWTLEQVIKDGVSTPTYYFQNVAYPNLYFRRNNGLIGAKEAALGLYLQVNKKGPAPYDSIAFFAIASGKTFTFNNMNWNNTGAYGIDRWRGCIALDELDPSNASAVKLELSAVIKEAQALALTVLPENEYLSGFVVVELNNAITAAKAVYDNGTSTDENFASAKANLSTAMETFSTTIKYWTDFQTATTNAENRINFVAPKTVATDTPGFLEYSETSALDFKALILELKGALSQFNANGTSIEEIASPVIEANAALSEALAMFYASRGLPKEDAWYVIYSFGAPGGNFGTDRWIMNMSKRIEASTTSGGDTTIYRLNRVFSPRELFADSVYTAQYKQKPIMHPNDSMLWKITYVEHESGPRYNIMNKANSDSDNQVYLCTDITIDGKGHQNTGLLNIPVPVKLDEGRDDKKTAGIMGIADPAPCDNDNNGWYFMDGELGRSFGMNSVNPTDTLFVKQEVGDTIVYLYYPLVYDMRPDRARYLWSFQPVDEAGNFFLQTLTPGGVDKAPTAAVKVIASPVPSEDQVTIQLPAGVELVSARLTNMSGQQLMSIGGESFSIAALPAGIYNLTVVTTQGVSSVKVIRK